MSLITKSWFRSFAILATTSAVGLACSDGVAIRSAAGPATDDGSSGIGRNGQTGAESAPGSDGGTSKDRSPDASTETTRPSDPSDRPIYVKYTLVRAAAPNEDEVDAYAKITDAMNKAIAYYNAYTTIKKDITVLYDPGVNTADGSINGTIRFGSRGSMHFATAMHEIAHVLGVGTHPGWQPLIADGKWTGPMATAKLREFDPGEELHADSAHFWPYGLNSPSEFKSDDDAFRHCKIVASLREDMGITE